MQIFHNIRKLEKVWADDQTLDRVAERALSLKQTVVLKACVMGQEMVMSKAI